MHKIPVTLNLVFGGHLGFAILNQDAICFMATWSCGTWFTLFGNLSLEVKLCFLRSQSVKYTVFTSDIKDNTSNTHLHKLHHLLSLNIEGLSFSYHDNHKFHIMIMGAEIVFLNAFGVVLNFYNS